LRFNPKAIEIMKMPTFAESRHPLIQALHQFSDADLLTLFQRHPEVGKYFVAIFSRYGPIVYTLIGHSVRSSVQANYLFAVTWRHIYYELGGLDLHESSTEDKPTTLQNWLINITAVCINRVELPPVEAIHYSLPKASPPLWCYLEQALDRLHPLHRLIILMAQTFHWSETRISAYLQAEGERFTAQTVKQQLQEAYQQLEAVLPEDIREIYLEQLTSNGERMGASSQEVFNLNPLEPMFE
jgi:hypothetical protein